MRKTSRSTVEFSAAEIRRLIGVLALMRRVDKAIGFGPPDGDDAEQIILAIEAMLARRGVSVLEPRSSAHPSSRGRAYVRPPR